MSLPTVSLTTRLCSRVRRDERTHDRDGETVERKKTKEEKLRGREKRGRTVERERERVKKGITVEGDGEREEPKPRKTERGKK